jgi:hypothetical protein
VSPRTRRLLDEVFSASDDGAAVGLAGTLQDDDADADDDEGAAAGAGIEEETEEEV